MVKYEVNFSYWYVISAKNNEVSTDHVGQYVHGIKRKRIIRLLVLVTLSGYGCYILRRRVKDADQDGEAPQTNFILRNNGRN